MLTLGELRKGIDALPEGTPKNAMLDWLGAELPQFIAGRVLPIDAHVADRWDHLVARAGRPLPAIDSLLAPTALVHGLTGVCGGRCAGADSRAHSSVNGYCTGVVPMKRSRRGY